MMNVGKIFERDFKDSAPDYCFVYRLPDPAQSFDKSTLRFATKNPCDYFVFNTKTGVLYALELKTTKGKSISFESIANNDYTRMIHAHQILSLKRMAEFNNIVSGFILNYRDDETGEQKTYFLPFNGFWDLYNNIGKYSFTQDDALAYGAVLLSGERKKTHYRWKYEDMFNYEGDIKNE